MIETYLLVSMALPRAAIADARCSIRVVRFDATLLAHIDIGYDEIGTLSMVKGAGSDACV